MLMVMCFFSYDERMYIEEKQNKFRYSNNQIPKNPHITNFFYIYNSIVIIFFDVVID